MAVDITANVLKISRSLLDVPDHRRYGYELIRSTGLRQTSMYRSLHHMEAHGWLISYLEEGDPRVLGRRLRRYYQLTETGHEAIVGHLQHWSAVLRGDHAA